MTMFIALASPRVAASAEECLERIERSISEAATRGAEIVCFPEAYLPGLRGLDFEVPPFDRAQQERALQAVAPLTAIPLAVDRMAACTITLESNPADADVQALIRELVRFNDSRAETEQWHRLALRALAYGIGAMATFFLERAASLL